MEGMEGLKFEKNGVAVARLREGLRSPLFLSSEMVSDLCRTLERAKPAIF